LLSDLYKVQSLEQAQYLHERINYLLARGIFGSNNNADEGEVEEVMQVEESKVQGDFQGHAIDFDEDLDLT
jgi:hypothetical protein